MAKNNTVVDEQGRQYGATWPKRAYGLVKKGRARFTDENTICLACPPDKITEDILMNDIINEKNAIPTEDTVFPSLKKDDITVEYILSQIEGIRKDNEYLNTVIAKLAQSEDISIPDLPHTMGESLGIVTKAEGFRDIVRCRETTNQKLIEFYEKVYNDIKPINPNSAKDLVVEMIRATNPGAEVPDYVGLLNTLNNL